MADRMFSAQQNGSQALGACWDYYFPFNATNVRADETYPSSFILLMRYSFHRPRDILTILDILGDQYGKVGTKKQFEYGDLFTSDFRRTYGDYLLGEIKDSLSFYYDEVEFELFLKFFEYLDGSQKFSYEKYLDGFKEFSNFLSSQTQSVPGFMKSAEEFLQFLYDQNILCFIEQTEEGERFIRWCFMERSPTNISPKVKLDLDYEIHYGLANVLNTGKELRRRRKNVRENLDVNRPRVHQLGEVESPTLEQTGKKSRNSVRSKAATPSQPRVERRAEPTRSATRQPGTGDGAIVQNRRGLIQMYNGRKGFGFVLDELSGADVFFHISAVVGEGRLKKGDAVQFDLAIDEQGRQSASFMVLSEGGA
jgi:cold shock CspA family protein